MDKIEKKKNTQNSLQDWVKDLTAGRLNNLFHKKIK